MRFLSDLKSLRNVEGTGPSSLAFHSNTRTLDFDETIPRSIRQRMPNNALESKSIEESLNSSLTEL